MKKSIILLCLTLGSTMLQAQKTITYTHTDKLFNDGCEMYDLQNYGLAFRYFDEYLQQFRQKTATSIMPRQNTTVRAVLLNWGNPTPG